jgi:hypothetical protein
MLFSKSLKSILASGDEEVILEYISQSLGYGRSLPSFFAIRKSNGLSLDRIDIYVDAKETISLVEGIQATSLLEQLKIFDKAKEDTLQSFRQEHGVSMVASIMSDKKSPPLLKELITQNVITYLGFDKITKSLDAAAEHCVYVYLSGETLLGVRTNMQSDSFVDIFYEYGDHDIIESIHFHDVVNDNELLPREATMQEGVDAYNYLMQLLSNLDQEVFSDYLLERDESKGV